MPGQSVVGASRDSSSLHVWLEREERNKALSWEEAKTAETFNCAGVLGYRLCLGVT